MRSESAYALATRAVQAVAMVAAAACVATRLSLPEQGLFFVFLSLGALLQVADFGLGYASIQVASHLAAVPDGHDRLADFARRAGRLGWWLVTGVAAAVGAAGAALLSAGETSPHWAGPWLAFVVSGWAMQRVNLALQLLEGVRSAAEAWRLRLVMEGVGGVIFVAALLLGAGLWSLALHWGVRAAVATAMGALWPPRPVPAGAGPMSSPSRVDWWAEVWPFQWRIGLSAVSGFFVFQAMNPIVLLQQGSAAAGRFGLSLALMNLLLLATSAWPMSLAARWGGWLAAGELAALKRSLRQTLLASTVLAVLLALVAVAGVAALEHSGHDALRRLAQRVADPLTTGLLLVAGVLHHIVFVLAVVLRAERREPLLAPSVLGGAVTVVLLWFAAGAGGSAAPAAASAGMALAGLAWVGWLYRDFARRVFGAGGGVR